jgi:hypothetical protein
MGGTGGGLGKPPNDGEGGAVAAPCQTWRRCGEQGAAQSCGELWVCWGVGLSAVQLPLAWQFCHRARQGCE